MNGVKIALPSKRIVLTKYVNEVSNKMIKQSVKITVPLKNDGLIRQV